MNRNFPNWNAKQGEKGRKKKARTDHPRQKGVIYAQLENRKRKHNRQNILSKNSWGLSKIKDKHWTTDSVSSEDTKQG